ncbi:MAG: class I mannose-6-phosphate isomerase [Clostridia bacterium]|nr:class I mannose-6-phosphate isomerase [Clostridia bacterium]
MLYPVKLAPALKDYLWGGDRLKREFNKKCELEKLAESWELSAHKDGESVVVGGACDGLKLSEYVARIGKEALGENAKKYDYFPLLIKLIDARGDLSVQVHPSDSYALENEGEYGKTEMWYILGCEEGASLYYGFAKDVSIDEYKNAIKEGRLTDLLNKVPVKPGDVFFIPAGTVHAIGAGILICEIQQNSNTTYRVYDYNRRDKDGNLRPLHIEKALAVSDLKRSPELPCVADSDDALLSSCEYFEVRRLRCCEHCEIAVDRSSFLSLIVTEGEGKLTFDGGELAFSKGDSIFIPAQNAVLCAEGSCELIVSKVR